MAIPWIEINLPNPSPIVEILNCQEDPVAVYKARYLQKNPGGNFNVTAIRTEEEIFNFFDESSSVLLFGSGHSWWANRALKHHRISSVGVLDYVGEAGLGLNQDIPFYYMDIVEYEGVSYDYVYSAHTVEHFSRENVLDVVLPKCLEIAKKAVVFVVPYGSAWSDEPSHRCIFYETDELAAKADRFKIIRDGQELVLWFGVATMP